MHGFAAPLLGGNGRIGGSSEAGLYGALGSVSGGGVGRVKLGEGLSLLVGLGYARENYRNASMKDTLLAAATLRYIHDISATTHVFGDIGGWLSPSGTYAFPRTYANGAGVAVGSANTGGDQYYAFGRIGTAFDITPSDEIAFSGEFGHQWLHTSAYSEPLSNANPFNASVSAGTDTVDILKARAQWTRQITPEIDATLWAAGAFGFNYTSNIVANIPGVGTFAPGVGSDLRWLEFGGRMSYSATDMISFDVFVDGVSGSSKIGTRAHFGGGVRVRF